MTFYGPDLNSYKVGFDYALAKQQGCTVTYVKLGGNNMSGNRPYFSPSYAPFIDQARANGYLHVGHFWVVGGYDIEGSANFFADHLRNVTPDDFFVLDNEVLDSGRRWSDDECRRFFSVLIARGINYNLFLYGARDNDLERNRWDATLALNVKILSAFFNNNPLVNHYPDTVPRSAVKGHQYTSSASVGGKALIDMNAFTDDAFTSGNFNPDKDGFDMATVDDLQKIDDESTTKLLDAIRREARGRLFFCPTPPEGYPRFVIIFAQRDPGDKNVLYVWPQGDLTDEQRAKNLNTTYGQTSDTVQAAMAVPDTTEQYKTRIQLALGTDPAFVNTPPQ